MFDLVDKNLKTDSIVVTGTVDTTALGDYTITYTLTDNRGNETVLTRVVTVVIPVVE